MMVVKIVGYWLAASLELDGMDEEGGFSCEIKKL